MVLVDVEIEGEQRKLYCDGTLYENIQKKIIVGLNKKDVDRVEVIDGGEGAGKSVFAQQIAKLVDPSFNLDRICFTSKDFLAAVRGASKGQAVVFDEAFRGMSSRGSLSDVNRLMVSLMMEMRQKNLFVIIVIPTFFLLDKYVALWRARGLFHIYKKRGMRGYWCYFNYKKKMLLYHLGRKTYSYLTPRSGFRGRFNNTYTVNEDEYRKKKASALSGGVKTRRLDKFKEQRDGVVRVLVEKLGIGGLELERKLGELGVKLPHNTVSDILSQDLPSRDDENARLSDESLDMDELDTKNAAEKAF